MGTSVGVSILIFNILTWLTCLSYKKNLKLWINNLNLVPYWTKPYCPSKWWVEVWASAQTIGGKEEVHRSSSAWQDDRISLHYLGRMQFPTDDSHYSLSFGGVQAPTLSWTFATKGEIDILILVHELLI